MNFEVTYWGSRSSVEVGKITLVRGKPTLVNEAAYADIYRYFPHDIEAKVRGASRWHYQAPRLKVVSNTALPKTEPTVPAPVVKPVPVELPKTEPTAVAPKPSPVEFPTTEPTVEAPPVDSVIVVDVTASDAIEAEMVDLTLEERIANLIPECSADIVTKIADELVSGSATQDSIMALAGVKARVAKRILKLVGG